MTEEKDFDALQFKRKISEQFSQKYRTKEGLVNWEKLEKDIREDKKQRPNK